MQDESAVRLANLALSFWASRAFCFWRLAGAAAENAARARTTTEENIDETMMTMRKCESQPYAVVRGVGQ